MKLLFTNSPQHFSHGHSHTQKSWPTFVLPYLAAICGDKHEYHIHDHMTAKESLVTAVKRFKPDIIGFSIIASRDLWNTIKSIKQVKGCGAMIIAGGQGTTAHWEELVKLPIDTVFKGECEQTIPDWLNALNSGKFIHSIGACVSPDSPHKHPEFNLVYIMVMISHQHPIQSGFCT